MNLAAAALERDGTGAAVTFAGHRLPVPAGLLEGRPALAGYLGGEVILGARPSDFEDATLAAPDWARMPVTADLTEALGSEIHVMFTLPAAPVQHPDLAALSAAGSEGDETGVVLDPGGTRWIARVSARSKITPGSPAGVAVDTTALYFFDPETGASITH
jgi:multiple sugar transport system ATP-binding protein